MSEPRMTDTSRVHVSKKEYWVIFVVLTVLTLLEVGLVYVPGIEKTMLVLGLVLMALAKAGLVGLFFMHLKHETTVVRWGVFIPLASPFFYALVLVSEAAWRLAG